jgi:hypothetical protein
VIRADAEVLQEYFHRGLRAGRQQYPPQSVF